jgi:hypothetical protein
VHPAGPACRFQGPEGNGTVTAIDELLADARIPTGRPDAFDVGAALRRLARDAATATVEPDRPWSAPPRLGSACRWCPAGC